MGIFKEVTTKKILGEKTLKKGVSFIKDVFHKNIFFHYSNQNKL